VREIPHKYPSFRATGYATADSVSMRATPAWPTHNAIRGSSRSVGPPF